MINPVFDKVLKSSHAFRLVEGDIRSGLGHAYAVISSDDEMVNEFFTLVALEVYCTGERPGCGICPECRKILHSNHPDIYHVNEAGEKIKVDDINKMISTVYIKSLSGKKLYFIHRADLMNVQSQNKLLKTLEEPPEGVTIFLGVANESALLSTVASRTRKLHIDNFSDEEIANILRANGYGEDTCLVAAACSEGKLGKAKAIAASPEYTAMFDFALNILGKLERSSDVAETGILIASQKDIPAFLDVLSVIMRDMLVMQQTSSFVMPGRIHQKISALAEKYSPLALSQILSIINTSRRELSLNVSPLSVVDNLLFSILEVRHKCPKS